jgi:23S rRNA (pseudouridine1915-N3)-methyltransferase
MQIQILQIAPTKDANIAALEAEYEKRLRPFFKLESITIPLKKEDTLIKHLDPDAHIIALSPDASQLSSTDFATLIKKTRDHGPGRIQFLIGGSHGLHESVLAAAHQTLSFSKMTFTHEMIRVFLKEQIYRAATIIAGKRYHK